MKIKDINPSFADEQNADGPEVSDMGYLGTLIGDPNANRIVAVSTSAVFKDDSLTQNYWGIDSTDMDSGFQGHLYTNSNDVLVVRIPGNDHDIPKKVLEAIRANYEIWKSYTGIELSSSLNPIILASDHSRPPITFPTNNLVWYHGTLLSAAVSRYQEKREAICAFVLDSRLLSLLGINESNCSSLTKQATTTSILMDKNFAMQIAQINTVDCARTYFINKESEISAVLEGIPDELGLVLKPAGGAAGIGLLGNESPGAGKHQLHAHINALKRNDQLPERFQIQEFLEGEPYGITAYFKPEGGFEIFEIHRQRIDKLGRFTGGSWSSDLQTKQMPSAIHLCQQLEAIKEPPFTGLICLDIVDHKIIEINPRLTASAPIAHILRHRDNISAHRGPGFDIVRIDLNTKVEVPYEYIEDGTLERIIKSIWEKHGVLALPQGLNPFGYSRFAFINDDIAKTGQQSLIKQTR